MAAHDNVRVLYEDGLVLGADELMDDQRYVRAALARRSLARDVPGIAYGLELVDDDGHVYVEPGVAYGGDGRVIVVRSRISVTSQLDYARVTADFGNLLVRDPTNPDLRSTTLAVHLTYGESREGGLPIPALCGQGQDPRVAEGFAITVVDGTRSDHLERIPPYEELAENLASRSFPVLLGRVAVVVDDVQKTCSSSVEMQADKSPCEAAAEGAFPKSAQYAGGILAGLVHPRRWNDGGIGAHQTPSLELHPERGIRANEPLTLLSNLLVRGSSPDEGADLRFEDGELVLSFCQEEAGHEVLAVRRTPGPDPEEVIEVAFLVRAKAGDFEELNAKVLKGIGSLAAKSASFADLAVSEGTSLKGAVTVVPVDPTSPPPKILDVVGNTSLEGKVTIQPGDPQTDLLEVGNAASFAASVDFFGPVSFHRPAALDDVSVKDLEVTGGLRATAQTARFGAISVADKVKDDLTVEGVLRVQGARLEARAAAAHLDSVTLTGSATQIFDTDGSAQLNHAVVASGGGVAAPSAAGSDEVVGVMVGRMGQQAQVVCAGLALAMLAPGVKAGDWLATDAHGALTKANATAGKRVAKALEDGPGPKRVVVSLG